MKSNTKELDNANEQSELERLLSKKPSWVVLWGLPILGLIICIMFFLWTSGRSQLTIYIKGSIKVQQSIEPIVIRHSGILGFLSVKSGSKVSRGEPIAYIFVIQDSNYIRIDTLLAVAEGQIIFPDNISTGQKVSQTDRLFFIVSKRTNFYGDFFLDKETLSQVQLGQQFFFTLENYQTEPSGQFMGQVTSIDKNAAKDGKYLCKVKILSRYNSLLGDAFNGKSVIEARAKLKISSSYFGSRVGNLNLFKGNK